MYRGRYSRSLLYLIVLGLIMPKEKPFLKIQASTVFCLLYSYSNDSAQSDNTPNVFIWYFNTLGLSMS